MVPAVDHFGFVAVVLVLDSGLGSVLHSDFGFVRCSEMNLGPGCCLCCHFAVGLASNSVHFGPGSAPLRFGLSTVRYFHFHSGFVLSPDLDPRLDPVPDFGLVHYGCHHLHWHLAGSSSEIQVEVIWPN